MTPVVRSAHTFEFRKFARWHVVFCTRDSLSSAGATTAWRIPVKARHCVTDSIETWPAHRPRSCVRIRRQCAREVRVRHPQEQTTDLTSVFLLSMLMDMAAGGGASTSTVAIVTEL